MINMIARAVILIPFVNRFSGLGFHPGHHLPERASYSREWASAEKYGLDIARASCCPLNASETSRSEETDDE